MRNIVFLMLMLLPLSSNASVPRPCQASEEELHLTLVALASTARQYVAKEGALPGMWSAGMGQIIESTNEMKDVGGNVNPGGDRNSLELMCSDIESGVHTIYSIDLTTQAISSWTVKPAQ
ncbi:hypothetical protein LJ739_11435 [Aestuariibacter halophilus]|uniref:Uncharacterized protein n=2 Tax=Fluctibacter halophilus TaxID=226011 RepID=A0ABS8G8I1_9ALTE|nr:hypothetical protein [Aestuariibacter halophilus]